MREAQRNEGWREVGIGGKGDKWVGSYEGSMGEGRE